MNSESMAFAPAKKDFIKIQKENALSAPKIHNIVNIRVSVFAAKASSWIKEAIAWWTAHSQWSPILRANASVLQVWQNHLQGFAFLAIQPNRTFRMGIAFFALEGSSLIKTVRSVDVGLIRSFKALICVLLAENTKLLIIMFVSAIFPIKGTQKQGNVKKGARSLKYNCMGSA